VFLAVEACLNGVFGLPLVHGKSPCFSRLRVSTVVNVDVGVLIFWVVDGAFLHE
jgi:hypothetical protein